MTDRSFEPTRRQLLGAVVGTGAIGATAGVTVARLDDRDSASATIQAGEVSVALDCAECFADGGTIGFAFGELEPGDSGSETFDIAIEDNPSRLWFRTECPPAVDPLGEAIQIELAFRRNGEKETLFSEDSLDEFRDEFSDGTRLDDRLAEPCCASDDDLALVLEYRLPSSAEWTADLRTDLRFELFAEQCRYVSESDVDDPFVDEIDACPELDCPDCVELGKFDVSNDRIEPGTYEFDELERAFADDGHTYELDVLTVTNKDDGETVAASVRLLKDGAESDAPPLCRIDIGGGKPENPPGPAYNEVDIDPPTTRTRGELFTKEMNHHNTGKGKNRDGKTTQPAISNIVVSVCADETGGDDK